jgi:hypothetical protein
MSGFANGEGEIRIDGIIVFTLQSRLLVAFLAGFLAVAVISLLGEAKVRHEVEASAYRRPEEVQPPKVHPSGVRFAHVRIGLSVQYAFIPTDSLDDIRQPKRETVLLVPKVEKVCRLMASPKVRIVPVLVRFDRNRYVFHKDVHFR